MTNRTLHRLDSLRRLSAGVRRLPQSTKRSTVSNRERQLRATLTGASERYSLNLAGVRLESADLAGADLRKACFDDTRLGFARLNGACLAGASLRGANLVGADLRGADLQDVDLRGANLAGAHLRSARLPRADLTGACLSQAHLGSADLSFARLIETNLEGANLAGSIFYGATYWNVQIEGACQRDLQVGSPTGPAIVVDTLAAVQAVQLYLSRAWPSLWVPVLTPRLALIALPGGTGWDLVDGIARDWLRSAGFLPISVRNARPADGIVASLARGAVAALIETSVCGDPLTLLSEAPGVSLSLIGTESPGDDPAPCSIAYQYASLEALRQDLVPAILEPLERSVLTAESRRRAPTGWNEVDR